MPEAELEPHHWQLLACVGEQVESCRERVGPVAPGRAQLTRHAPGTSEWTTAQITEAWGVAEKLGMIGPAMEQPEYNLFNRKKARLLSAGALSALCIHGLWLPHGALWAVGGWYFASACCVRSRGSLLCVEC